MQHRHSQDLGVKGRDKPYIVNRLEIPPLSAPADATLEIRPFLGHGLLAAAVSSAPATLLWLEVRPGARALPQGHPRPGLLVILRGRGELVGNTSRVVEQGDVVTLPSHLQYELSAAGPEGLEALQIIFTDDSASEPENGMTLADVLTRNEARLRTWLSTPYFRMLQDGTLDSSRMRARFMQCIRIFSDIFQTFLFSRQAMCRESDYHSAFLDHLTEEFGHNKLLKAANELQITADPTLQATLSWFCHQMLVLDNAGKAIVNLVLESGGYHFHNLAKPVFSGDDVQDYFDTHAEDDEQHQNMGLELLQGQHRVTYASLVQVLDESWDMLNATTQRIFELVHLQETSS
jgi:hypothetical protein